MTLTELEDMWIDLSRAQREAIHVDWGAVIADWEQSLQKKVVYLDRVNVVKLLSATNRSRSTSAARIVTASQLCD